MAIQRPREKLATLIAFLLPLMLVKGGAMVTGGGPAAAQATPGGKVKPPKPDFMFRGGCTLLIDLETCDLRYCIFKRINSSRRLESQRRFLSEHLDPSLRATYFGDPRRVFFDEAHREAAIEPLALLHRAYDREEVL